MHITLLRALVLFPALVAAGCAVAGDPGAAGTPQVQGTTTPSILISGFAFSPASISIAAGSTVTWTNNDGFSHTVTSTAGSPAFNSGAMGNGAVFSVTFSTVGTWNYRCGIHTTMLGTIVVTN